MIEIGKYNELKILRKSDNGLYLVDESGEEVLLPNKYCPEDFKLEDKIEVFVYRDSEEKKIATNLKPDILLHELKAMIDSWLCTTLSSMTPKVEILLDYISWAVVTGTSVSSSCIGLEKEDSQHSLVQMQQSKPLKLRIQSEPNLLSGVNTVMEID